MHRFLTIATLLASSASALALPRFWLQSLRASFENEPTERQLDPATFTYSNAYGYENPIVGPLSMPVWTSTQSTTTSVVSVTVTSSPTTVDTTTPIKPTPTPTGRAGVSMCLDPANLGTTPCSLLPLRKREEQKVDVVTNTIITTMINTPPASHLLSYPEASRTSTASSTSGLSLNPAVVQAIMPSSGSCSGAEFPDECATAEHAAPFVAHGWTTYNINSRGAQAATLALMAYESGEFKFNQAHFPPTPGKGTRNMQSPTFNVKYAAAVFGSSSSSDPITALNSMLPDQYSFASASWFLAMQCPTVLRQFASDPDGAWTEYLGSSCIDTTDNSQRDAYWVSAKAALGVGS
jgi:hypothetical protein